MNNRSTDGYARTETFPVWITPVRKGVYEIWDKIMRKFYFDYWDGKQWSAGGWDSPKEAFKRRGRYKHGNQLVDGWRGLARRPR